LHQQFNTLLARDDAADSSFGFSQGFARSTSLVGTEIFRFFAQTASRPNLFVIEAFQELPDLFLRSPAQYMNHNAVTLGSAHRSGPATVVRFSRDENFGSVGEINYLHR
jgi:hypothetical protein